MGIFPQGGVSSKRIPQNAKSDKSAKVPKDTIHRKVEKIPFFDVLEEKMTLGTLSLLALSKQREPSEIPCRLLV